MQISADIMKIVKNGFNNTSFFATKKASNMAMSVSRFINIHELKCHIIHNYCYYTILVFVKVLKVLVNKREKYAVYSKTAVKANCVDK